MSGTPNRSAPAQPHPSPLVAALTELRRQAGMPSYRDISIATDHVVPSNSAYRMFSGTTRVPGWNAVELVVRALGGDPQAFYPLWEVARQPQARAIMFPAPDADLGGGVRPEYRVMGTPDRQYAVAELTRDQGLTPVLSGLHSWQAYAIVAILHHPFEE